MDSEMPSASADSESSNGDTHPRPPPASVYDTFPLRTQRQRAAYRESLAAPRPYVCPITQDLFVDPVVAADGHTYERPDLLRWFSIGTGPEWRSPTTGRLERRRATYDNAAVRGMVMEYRREVLGKELLWRCSGMRRRCRRAAA
eukprot:CAMPEP_0194338162 /NCGR_PEP_ID=MMETSP0171-20130528/78581_1 /TAXON_ID=218684 /ORGANISM="Corethron pennatum, Strain L29A3" /LENGTH=143 /DNA_ID=CAMNT_0039102191 /DNA_START=25 /DNA_END=452 /DNA_ORIENTATION=+